MSNALPAKIDITRDDIARVVKHFYAAVRKDPNLGPVFAHSIDPNGWRDHEAKIVRFWANAILHENDYAGNPFLVHRAQGHVKPEHFEIWLNLFQDSLNTVLPPMPALQFNNLAQRIGASLKMGLQGTRAQARGVPHLH
jgi:hemoglobin